MRKLKRISEKVAERLDEPRLSVAPLIDVCFLLMVYFMVTTTILPAERDVTTRMATEGPASMEIPPVTIHVRGDGVIALNPGPHEIIVSIDPNERSLLQLRDHLETLMIGVEDLPPVLVRADGEAQHQRVVDVMNLLQQIGWSRVGFIDEPEEDG